MEKLLYLDLETTGTDPELHAIYELGAILEINGTVVDKFSLKMAPFPEAEIDPEAFTVSRDIDIKKIKALPDQSKQLEVFLDTIKKYLKSNYNDKFLLTGFNVLFDQKFLRNWFLYNNKTNYNAYFWSNVLDVQVLAGAYLQSIRHKMKNFKLETVAKTLGIPFDTTKAHGAMYDIKTTKSIHDKIIKNWKKYKPKK